MYIYGYYVLCVLVSIGVYVCDVCTWARVRSCSLSDF